MEEACRIIERIVNTQISQRKQFSLEWGEALGAEGSVWQPNVAAANCYSGGKENVGFHSDALTYLGPYPTIASLSLGKVCHSLDGGLKTSRQVSPAFSVFVTSFQLLSRRSGALEVSISR
jgi:hypothetical protein